MFYKKYCINLLLVLILVSPSLSADTSTIRIASVVIVQQEDFLQSVIQPFLASTGFNASYTQGHHSEVAKLAAASEADLVITHDKVKRLHKLEKQGILNPGELVFANPMAFLGPRTDPAGINGLTDPVQAIQKLLEAGFCFLINNHDRLRVQQRQLLNSANVNDGCVMDTDEQNESILDSAHAHGAYTIWGLHPYARKGEDRLQPVVIPHPSLLMNMTAWVVKDSAQEEAAKQLQAYLQTDEAKKLITSFRLKSYPNTQAWWLPVTKYKAQ